MRICARDLAVGDILHINDWQLHVLRIERERNMAILTAEFDFLMHFAQDDFVTVQASATAAWAMTKHPFAGPSDPVPVIDIGHALDLLAAAVAGSGDDLTYEPVRIGESGYLTSRHASRHAARSGPDCIVRQALAFADVCVQELTAIPEVGVRELYIRGELPVTLTLGALAVFHAAQDSQDHGCRRDDLLAHANAAALRFLDLLPDTIFPAVADTDGHRLRALYARQRVPSTQSACPAGQFQDTEATWPQRGLM
jgi:hypothetical protein